MDSVPNTTAVAVTPMEDESPIDDATNLLGSLNLAIAAAKILMGRLKRGSTHETRVLAPSVHAFTWPADEHKTRISLLPIRHQALWEFRKVIEKISWDAQEIDNSRNKTDWEQKMTPDQRHFVKFQLAFFARIDVDIFDHIEGFLAQEVNCMEARAYYAAQSNQEMTHAESYGLQIESVMDGEEREKILNAVKHFPIIAKIQAWVLRWFNGAHLIGPRLIAFAAVEGVLFSASFSSLQWLREINLLPGITSANEFIVRDEWIHTQFTCCLVKNYLVEKPPLAIAHSIFAEVVEVLDEFVTESLPVKLIGMNADLMKNYVRFQADFVLMHMGYAPIYQIDNPFKFMEKFTLNEVVKVNFFEDRGTQYQNVSTAAQGKLAIDRTVIE